MKIANLARLMGLLRTRLRSTGHTKSLDAVGNVVYIDTDIYDHKMLETFIDLSISEFNQIPYFTFYTLEDDKFVSMFSSIIVEGAVLYALGSQALIERGREFQVKDSGISFDPPTISELLNTQYEKLLSLHFEKLKLIKSHKMPFDKG